MGNFPEGNYLQITRLGDEWLRRAKERRSRGHRVLARWKATKE